MKNQTENYNLFVSKSSKLKGTVKAPPSKSYTHRAIIIGSMNGSTKIANPLYCDDTNATIQAWRTLGAKIHTYNDHLDIVGFNGNPSLSSNTINVKEAGTLLRFILSVLPLGRGKFTIVGEKTLCNRPNTAIVSALRSMGVEISGREADHKLPITINAKGELAGGSVEVSGKMSSQVVSSLLITAPLAKSDTTITVKDTLVSKPYVDITIDVLNWAGIEVENDSYRMFKVKSGQKFSPQSEFVVHGDYSSSAFLIAACCLIESDVVIKDLVIDKQGDRKIIELLNAMGASIKHKNGEVKINGPYKLKGQHIDCCDIPDLVPILVVLGTFAEGKTKLYNISHLVYKESNRVISTSNEIVKMGGKVSVISNNELVVYKSDISPDHVVSSNNDHRVAMALAVLGMKVGRLTIENADCIAKSYPDFIDDMKHLGALLSFRKKVTKERPKNDPT
ncbi:MAG: 3-phosphoshikimate 1-carboxyvinyltransferase [Elusimicrobiota bacterium]|nr:3-phosphoshikimate 1-carboxyvinyltransferase [Elusimicrobiota bacterium]